MLGSSCTRQGMPYPLALGLTELLDHVLQGIPCCGHVHLRPQVMEHRPGSPER